MQPNRLLSALFFSAFSAVFATWLFWPAGNAQAGYSSGGAGGETAGFIQAVPDGYGLTAIGYGSDDHRCWVYIKTAPVDASGQVNFGAISGWQATACGYNMGGVNDQYAVEVPSEIAVGWTWGANTSGGMPGNDSYPTDECYYQEYAPLNNINNRSGWGSAYDGTCSERGYSRDWLKQVAYAPSGQVIVAVGLSLANDAKVDMVAMQTRTVPPPSCQINSFTADDTTPGYNQATTLRFSLSGNFSWSISAVSGAGTASPNSGTSNSGSSNTSNLTGAVTYRLSCGSDTSDVTIIPDSPPAAPTVDLRVTVPSGPTSVNGPVSVTTGSNVRLEWTTTGNPTSCTASGSWSGSKSTAASGNEEWQTNLASGSHTYTIQCSNAGGSSAPDSVTVNVGNMTISASVNPITVCPPNTTGTTRIIVSAPFDFIIRVNSPIQGVGTDVTGTEPAQNNYSTGNLTWVTHGTVFYLIRVSDGANMASVTVNHTNSGCVGMIDGACGSANGVPVSSAPTSGLCSAGTASAVTGTGPWNWTCAGSGGGSTASCNAPRSGSIVNGSCGGAAQTYAASATNFSGAFCSSGTANPSFPSFPGVGGSTTWWCNGSGGGSNVQCTASRLSGGTVGSCGSAAQTYAASATNFSGAFCNVGSPVPFSPAFPAAGGSTTWYCQGSSGNSPTCTATRQSGSGVTCTVLSTPPLVSGSPVTMLASGGSGFYSWSAPTGNPNSGSGTFFSPSFGTGTHTVNVVSGSQSGVCTFSVGSSGQPDLAVTDFHYTDAAGNAKSAFAPGEPIYPWVTIRNQGTAGTSGAFFVSAYSNSPAPVANGTPSDVDVFVNETGSIGAGMTKTYSITQNSNMWNRTSWSKPAAGSYTGRISADSFAYIGESDETNNQLTAAYTVGALSSPPSVNIDLPAAGASVSGTVQIAGWALDNSSRVETAISSVRVYIDGALIGNATAYGRADVCAVYPGRAGCPNVGYQFNWNTASVSNGLHTIRLVATDSDSPAQTAFVERQVNVNNAPSACAFTGTSFRYLKFENIAPVNWTAWRELEFFDRNGTKLNPTLIGGTPDWVYPSQGAFGKPSAIDNTSFYYQDNPAYYTQWNNAAPGWIVPFVHPSYVLLDFGTSINLGRMRFYTQGGPTARDVNVWVGNTSASQPILLKKITGTYADVFWIDSNCLVPAFSVNPASLSFNGVSGGAAPAARTLTIGNSTRASNLNWRGTTDQNWCFIDGRNNSSSVTGTETWVPGSSHSITVSAPSNVGVFTCRITLTENGSTPFPASNSPTVITVTYTVTAGLVNGACGSANGVAVSAAPSSNLCSAGTASAVTGAGPWNWACNGSGGGSNASCSAPRLIPPCTPLAYRPATSGFSLANTGPAGNSLSVSASQAFYAYADYGSVTDAISPPVSGSNICTWEGWNGTAARFRCVAPAALGSYTYTTGTVNYPSGSNICTSGPTSMGTVTVNPPAVNGACGSANGQAFTSAPSSNLCSAGTASAVTGAGPWNWTCNGSGGGSNASCSATRLVAPTGFGGVTSGGGAWCEKVTLTWTDNAVGEQGFRIYRNSTTNFATAALVATVPSTSVAGTGTNYTYMDAPPMGAGQYYWLTAYAGTVESAPAGPTGELKAQDCNADMGTSDKDIVSVNGTVNSTNTCGTNGEFPSTVQFKVGDVVGFKINLCNNKPADVQGVYPASQIVVEDTLYNLERVDKALPLTDKDAWKASVTGALSLNRIEVVSGSEPANLKLRFVLNGTLPEGPGASTLAFSAKVALPPNFSGTSSRFQNSASITYVVDNTGTPVATPLRKSTPLLMFVKSQVPTKNETAP